MDAGFEALGITAGMDNVAKAKEQYNIMLFEQDMHFLPYPADFFDAVVLIHTYEHAYAPTILLGELYYILRPGGRIYVACPDAEDPNQHTIWHVNLKTEKQIIDDFFYWGFKLVTLPVHQDTRDRYKFVFEKLPPAHEEFKNWNYLQHIYQRRKAFS